MPRADPTRDRASLTARPSRAQRGEHALGERLVRLALEEQRLVVAQPRASKPACQGKRPSRSGQKHWSAGKRLALVVPRGVAEEDARPAAPRRRGTRTAGPRARPPARRPLRSARPPRTRSPSVLSSGASTARLVAEHEQLRMLEALPEPDRVHPAGRVRRRAESARGASRSARCRARRAHRRRRCSCTAAQVSHGRRDRPRGREAPDACGVVRSREPSRCGPGSAKQARADPRA